MLAVAASELGWCRGAPAELVREADEAAVGERRPTQRHEEKSAASVVDVEKGGSWPRSSLRSSKRHERRAARKQKKRHRQPRQHEEGPKRNSGGCKAQKGNTEEAELERGDLDGLGPALSNERPPLHRSDRTGARAAAAQASASKASSSAGAAAEAAAVRL